MTMNLFDRVFYVAIAGLVAALVAPASYGQVLPRREPAKANPANPAATAPAVSAATAPAATAPADAPGEIRREARQDARDARAEARDTANPRPEARDAARETRQETRQNIQASRAADFGVWLNVRGNQGLVIDDLSNNGVFATAGFRAGDQIVSINGQPVTTEAQFVQILSSPNLGTQPIQVVVIRDGQQQTIVLQPTALTQGIVTYDPFYQYGLVIDDSRPNQYIVQRVYPRTPAYYAGLRQGDVIVTLGGQRITSLDVLTQGLSRANGTFALGVTRGDQTRDIQLDSSGVNVNGSVRTALRPNLDADANTRTDARGEAEAQPRTRNPAGTTAPATRDSAAPATPAPRAAPQAVPPLANPALPANPAQPNTVAPRAGAPAPKPGAKVPGPVNPPR